SWGRGGAVDDDGGEFSGPDAGELEWEAGAVGNSACDGTRVELPSKEQLRAGGVSGDGKLQETGAVFWHGYSGDDVGVGEEGRVDHSDL
ncbi:hypothetical protein Dimus_013914, partial [Dionaea muscipula]